MSNQLKKVIFTLATGTVLSLFARTAVGGDRVSVNRQSLNASLGETVSITVAMPGASRVSIAVVDRDGYVTRWLAKDAPAATGSYVAIWNGRDEDGAVVADEAYSFKVDVRSSEGAWTYFPAAGAPKTHPVQAKHYSRRDGALMYELPAAARIHAQAGSAAINETTRSYQGPVLKTLVNREPRPAGPIVESWNGFDESGAIYIPDLPQFVTAILATDLPENSVIAFGNKTRTFLDVAAGRRGSSLLPRKTHAHAHHDGLAALEDASPALVLTPINGTWSERENGWSIDESRLHLAVRLEGPTAPFVARQPGRILVFVDYKQVFERVVRSPKDTFDLPLGGGSATPHIVSINWQSDYGPLAANSIRVTNSAAGDAAGLRKGTRQERRIEH
jgi:hypothetical protein